VSDLRRFLPFDRLRYLIIILVVLQHAADSYGEVIPWWFVRDPDPATTRFFDLFRLLPDIIMMPALFFLAGFFVLPSLRKKGLVPFLGNKAVRLLGPWLACVTLIVPVIHYIFHLARADTVYQKGFFSYWALFLGDAGRFHAGFIHSMDQFNLNYAWFISLLFFFFLFFGLGYALKMKLSAATKNDPGGNGFEPFERGAVSAYGMGDKPKPGDSSGDWLRGPGYSWIILLAVGSLCSLSYYAINSQMSFERWIILYNVIQFQSPRLLVYICYFGLGVYAFTRQWFIEKPPPGRLLFWGSMSLALIAVYFPLHQQIFSGTSRPDITLLYSFVRYSLCLSLLFVLLLLACRYPAKPAKIQGVLAGHSYYLYLNHLFLVVVAQLFFRQFAALDSLSKFGGVAGFSVLGGYLCSYFLLKPFPRLSLLVILLSLLALGVATG
jgi:hypothetical protein